MFQDKLWEGVQDVDLDADTLWMEMQERIKKVASKVLGLSKGRGPRQQESWVE